MWQFITERLRSLFRVVVLRLVLLPASALALINSTPSSSSLPTSSSPSPPSPSLAQTCNEDVLLEIMENLAKSDLASAALVCRTWLPAARETLYTSIVFSPNDPHVGKLHCTLLTAPHLRGLIRRLHIGLFSSIKPAILEWISLLPEHSLQVISNMSPILDDGPTVILQYPAVRTAPHFALSGPDWLSDDRLNVVLNYQHLESLIVSASPLTQPLHLLRPCLPKLKRLSISSFEYYSTISEILDNIDGSLERFDFFGYEIHSEDIATLCTALERHIPTLKSVSFVWKVPPKIPFVDDLAASFPRLERLGCGFGTYTTRILARLPPTLRHIVLYSRPKGKWSSQEGDACALLIQEGAAPASLKNITLAHNPKDSPLTSCALLLKVCESKNIIFATVKQELPDRFQTI